MSEELEGISGFNIEFDEKKLQNLAIQVDKILREEIEKAGMKASFEARIYNIRTVGVQGDKRTYGHPAEITIQEPKHPDGRAFNEDEFYDFLDRLSIRITNEVEGVNKVVYVTATRNDRRKLYG